MAVQFTASSGQLYTSTVGLPTTNLFTITCWVYYAGSLQSNAAFWSLEGTSDFAWLGTGSSSSTLRFDWSGGGSTHTIGGTVSANIWYKVAVIVNGTAATLHHSYGGAVPQEFTESANFVLPTGALTLRIGGSLNDTNYVDGRLAAFKMWDAALTRQEIMQELSTYLPRRSANISRFHPFVNAETVDYSGLARTLSGGTGATTEHGPPIPWSGMRSATTPWSVTTTVWYAHYDTTSGELLSVGTVAPNPLPSGTAFLELLGQPNLAQYEWSTTARAFVLREGVLTADRVADLLADGTLASAWADLSAPDSAAMQARIGQMLGPNRTRLDFQDPDLA